MDTRDGQLELPQVASSLTLGGRQSKVIVTNYAFGSSQLLYSTAQVFFAGIIDGRDVLFLYGDSSQEHEASLAFSGTPNPLHLQPSLVNIQHAATSIVSFLPGIQGLVTIYDSDTQLVLFADRDTAATFWAPMLAGPDGAEFSNFWSFGSNTSILVGGPYLVRSAIITGTSLALKGDLKDDVRLTVIAPKAVRSIAWNGYDVSDLMILGSSISSGMLRTSSAFGSISVPNLEGWKFKDSLPEIGDYDDASWIVADHKTTNIPYKPFYGDGRVLYGCDYGLFVFASQT